MNLVTEAIGAQVEVMYDPLHPTRARETGRPFSKALNAILWYSIIAVLLAMAFCFK